MTFLDGQFVDWSGTCPVGRCGFTFRRRAHGSCDGWSSIRSDLSRHLRFAHGVGGDRLEMLLLNQEWERATVPAIHRHGRKREATSTHTS